MKAAFVISLSQLRVFSVTRWREGSRPGESLVRPRAGSTRGCKRRPRHRQPREEPDELHEDDFCSTRRATTAKTAAVSGWALPIALFSIPLGLAGLGGAWQAAAQLLGAPDVPAALAYAASAAVCAMFTVVHVDGGIRHDSGRFHRDLRHPLFGSLTAYIPVTAGAGDRAAAIAVFGIVTFWLLLGVVTSRLFFGTPLPQPFKPVLPILLSLLAISTASILDIFAGTVRDVPRWLRHRTGRTHPLSRKPVRDQGIARARGTAERTRLSSVTPTPGEVRNMDRGARLTTRRSTATPEPH